MSESSHQPLIQLIQQQISDAGHPLTFDQFMASALYSPGLGYYTGGHQKFGPSGDFTTAPELSPLFARCIAAQCQQVLTAINSHRSTSSTAPQNTILEFGAGSGILCANLLLSLESLQQLPDNYFILELSGELQQRQRTTLSQHCPHLLSRVQWLQQLPPQPITGIIIANEVLDAMPVKMFTLANGELSEHCVIDSPGTTSTASSTEQPDSPFQWTNETPSAELVSAIAHLQSQLPDDIASYLFNTEHYTSEINLHISPWINSVSQCLDQGLVLLIDYGFPRHEYYHPDRNTGTLMCHYQHRAHPDPLLNIGDQDITAHVDFTAIAEAAVAADLNVSGYCNQGSFLLGCGLLDYAASLTDSHAKLAANQQIKQLTLPSEMGELFKVIGLSRGLDDVSMIGFSFQDMRNRL